MNLRTVKVFTESVWALQLIRLSSIPACSFTICITLSKLAMISSIGLTPNSDGHYGDLLQ